ncbi:MAG: hypothetical protein M1376_10850 [Planctomycetes bacterium]|nr:hypothetical protein [Planctomycetota bacterium]
MNHSFTKLFSTIVTSTIWREDDKTRIVWITLLATADAYGEVAASIPGLAALANVNIADCERALQTLLSPDPYSRTRDHEGRRIEVIDGGWKILNYGKYRQVRDPEKRGPQNREAQRRWREKHRKPGVSQDNPQKAQAEAEAEAEKKPPCSPPNGNAGGNPDVLAVFTHWNSRAGASINKTDPDNGQEVHIHWLSRKLKPDGGVPTDAATPIRAALQEFDVAEVRAAIDNYAAVLLAEDTFWTYAWSLVEFFTRHEGRAKTDACKWWRFLPGSFDIEKYRSRKESAGAVNLEGAPEDQILAAYGKEPA